MVDDVRVAKRQSGHARQDVPTIWRLGMPRVAREKDRENHG